MGGTTTEQDVNACLDSEQKARDQIVKDRATYASADKKQCMRTDVYLPSYVEWLTCLEMERDVRKMQREDQVGTGPYTLPKVSPAINPAGIRRQRAPPTRLPARSGNRFDRPVMLLPGRARLVTRPCQRDRTPIRTRWGSST